MIVKVAPMGERVTEVNVEPGTKVREILEIADVDHADRSISLSNAPATLDTPVQVEGSFITLASKMKGGLTK